MVTFVDVVVPSGVDTTRIEKEIKCTGWNRRDSSKTSSSGTRSAEFVHEARFEGALGRIVYVDGARESERPFF